MINFLLKDNQYYCLTKLFNVCPITKIFVKHSLFKAKLDFILTYKKSCTIFSTKIIEISLFYRSIPSLTFLLKLFQIILYHLRTNFTIHSSYISIALQYR